MREWVQDRLRELEREGLLRDPNDSELHLRAPAVEWLDACSNDYLGLGTRSVSRETLEGLKGARLGAGASRLVQGTFKEHRQVERELADWLGTEDSLLTSSASAANVGSLPALADRDALIVSDELNHASIVDGCRLSRARVVVAPHLDVDAMATALRSRREQTAWVVTEGLFSMDGDCPDLRALRTICDQYGAGLMVDEAHSLGVLGPNGGGLVDEADVEADLAVAGLGKAVGAHGGVLASSTALRTWLWNRCRSFVFSTAPSPAASRLVLEQIRAARSAAAQRARLAELSNDLRRELRQVGVEVPAGSVGPIVPVVLGSNERAMNAMKSMREAGILVQAIRPPTVPVGSARLRITVHADWPEDAIPRLVAALELACES